MRQIRRHTSTPFPRIFLKNPARWAEPPGQARTRSPSQFPGHTAIGTKALGLLFLRRKVASQDILKRLKAMGITHLSGKAITANQVAKWRQKMMTELASENQAVARYELALKYVSGLEPVSAVKFLLRFGICPSTIPENP